MRKNLPLMLLGLAAFLLFGLLLWATTGDAVDAGSMGEPMPALWCQHRDKREPVSPE
jgi:hypothetical protein